MDTNPPPWDDDWAPHKRPARRPHWTQRVITMRPGDTEWSHRAVTWMRRMEREGHVRTVYRGPTSDGGLLWWVETSPELDTRLPKEDPDAPFVPTSPALIVAVEQRSADQGHEEGGRQGGKGVGQGVAPAGKGGSTVGGPV